jgi:predicted permease
MPMGTLWQDLRYGLRMLRLSPGFTAVAVLSLALGIGANTAIFNLLDAVMLKSLPVKDPQQLVFFQWEDTKPHPEASQTGADGAFSFSYPAFDEFRRQKTALSSVFAFVPIGFDPQNTTVGINGAPTLANGMMVTGEYFSGLGVAPALGRALTEEDEAPGAPRVAVISDAYWTRRFARDPGVLGRAITLNGIPATIVGVMPPSFYGVEPGRSSDLWLAFDDQLNLRPWSMPPSGGTSVYNARKWICLNIMGRLKPGVSRAQAQAALDPVFRRFLTADWTPPPSGDFAHLSLGDGGRGLHYLRRALSQPLNVLMAAVGFVLLIACANLATLLLARASARRREISVRLAIGASRSRLIRQLLTESILLSAMGGALGFLFAGWGTQMLVMLTAGMAGRDLEAIVTPNPTVLLFTIGVSMLTAILFGLAPAFRATRIELATSLKQDAGNVSEGRDKHRLAKSLVVAQVAASLVLMIGAGLFVQTLVNMQGRNFGFDQSNLLLFGLDATRDGIEGPRLADFYKQTLEQIRAVPGVQSATMLEYPPFSGVSNNTTIQIVGSQRNFDDQVVRFFTVAPGFFESMRIPLLLGRSIAETDSAASPKVAVVNDLFVRTFFDGQSPIGHVIKGPTDVISFQIVGVVKDVELTDVHADPMPKAYLSYLQMPDFLTSMYFEVRSTGAATNVLPGVREVVRRMDSRLPLLNLRTQQEQTQAQFTQEQMFARLSSFFGLLALLLAMIGLYGTMAYAVTRKTREIGIRIALGARSADVLRMVLGQGIKLSVIGISIGFFVALGVTRLVRTLIFGVTATDPLTFAAVAILLAVVALAACYIPARRAMRVDPMVALRYE